MEQVELKNNLNNLKLLEKKLNPEKERFIFRLAWTFVAGFFITLFALIYKGQEYKDTVNILIGSLATIVCLIAGYYWASSSGSADKTEILNKKLNNQTQDETNL